MNVLLSCTPDLIQREDLVVVELDQFLKTVHFLNAIRVFSKKVFEPLGQDVQLDVAPPNFFPQVVFRQFLRVLSDQPLEVVRRSCAFETAAVAAVPIKKARRLPRSVSHVGDCNSGVKVIVSISVRRTECFRAPAVHKHASKGIFLRLEERARMRERIVV